MDKITRLLVLIAVGFAVMAGPDSRAMAASKARGTRIYIVRGGGGYFPNLGTVINEKFRAKGLSVVERRFDERFETAYEIVNSYRKGELREGVILVGYSLGGCGAIKISRILQEYGIPVRMLFLIETINPLQTVPANVKDCFNLYHFPALLGVKVRADSEKTNLVNCEAYADAGFGAEYSHFALPFVDGVHDLIAGELVAALQDRPLGEESVNRFRLSSARSEEVKAASRTVPPKVVAEKKAVPKAVEEKTEAPLQKMRFSRGGGRSGWLKSE